MKFLEKYGLTLIIILGCSFYIILLVMCILQMIQLNDLDTRKLQTDHIHPIIHVTLDVSDSTLSDSATMAKIDSSIQVLKTYNNYCDNKMLLGLNDLRQETNNVIEKQNEWFSFWLGILALVGALFPFVVQLKIQHNQEEKIQMEIEKINGSFNDKEKIVEKEINKFKEWEKEREKNKLISEIAKISFTLITCKENKWSKNAIDRNQSWDDLLVGLRKNTNSLFDLILASKVLDKEESISCLKMVLLQLHAVYSVYIPTFSKAYKVRQLMRLIGVIGDVFEKLSGKRFSSEEDLRKALEDMQLQMSLIKL